MSRYLPLTLEDYWMGRNLTYADELTLDIKVNANELLRRVNALLDDFYAAYPKAYRRTVNSGWRPPAINAGVANAAPKSKHLSGEAIDLSDDSGMLGRFLTSTPGLALLAKHQLWMEHCSATPRWVHLQSVSPKSGRRIFYP